MVVSVTTMQRLALIKFLSGVAIEQSQRPEPLCSIAILTFHDAIELFLQLSCEHLDISMSKSKIGFLEYWELIAPKVSTGELTQKESMKRLNSARVEFKHNGTLPSKLAIEGFRVNATTFIEENTLAVFGIELSSVSLLDLVQCDEARTSLRESEELIKQNKIEDALDKAALAFQQLISDYEKRKTSKFGRSPFFFGRDMTFLSSFAMDFGQLGAGARFKQKMIEFVDKVNESLESLQQA
ncbi:MAG: hypothetical protein NTV42_04215, partial [Chloroflexi bacterium]|nr:hypothetical protein [Chloroflexota bacterium]